MKWINGNQMDKYRIIEGSLRLTELPPLAELMILGFISLLLTFVQYYVEKICIPESVGNTMLPCALRTDEKEDGKPVCPKV